MEADLPVFNHTDLSCESCATLVGMPSAAELLTALWAKSSGLCPDRDLT